MQSVINVKYISDIHLELLKDDDINTITNTIADSCELDTHILILAGDIGNPKGIQKKNLRKLWRERPSLASQAQRVNYKADNIIPPVVIAY